MQVWQYIACMFLACVVLLLWLRERRIRKLFAGIPHYPLLPFIGNVHQVFGDGKALFRHLERMAKICDSNGYGRFVLWIGPCPLLTTHDPDDVKLITNAFIEKPYMYSFGKVWLGDGLVTGPASVWKQNIKKLSGTFTTSVVDGYLGVFNAQAYKLVNSLKSEVGKEPFDIIHKYLAYTTLETICQTALGVSKISESIVTTEYYDAFNRCLELLITRGLNAALHPDFIYNMTPQYREMKKCVAVLHNVSDTVLKKRKLERENMKTEKQNEDDDDPSKPKFRAFLDMLLDLRELDPSLTEQQIKSEVDTIIVGGQETVASTMFFLLLMLGCKKRVQDKLYAELKSIFGDSKRPVTKDDLSQMKYLEAVINETLRLYPPVPGVMRYADKPLQIKSFTIPQGTSLILNFWGAGRSVNTWGKDASLYRPERWLEDPPPGYGASFLPFSYGRRACIGKKYAMSILKTVIAHCVRELEFVSQADNMQLKIDIALRPTSGHLIQVRERSK
ncbi:cytochrome P450 4C1-like [Anticarsia gemmatalis]|uniref:cytochrome P450 4C1-like n=1 Tax=Anticarsia gemmatalis TaxID=129554 RepID=UPI003F75D207